MSSAVEAREALSKLDNVIRVHPYGHNGKALVYFSDKKSFDEEKLEELLRTTSLRVRKVKRASS